MDPIKADILFNGTADEINNSNVDKVSEEGAYLSNRVPGYLGNAFDFDIAKSVDNATISFEVNQLPSYKSKVEPAIYFWNEEHEFLEKVENQTRSGNVFSTITDKFGKYMLLDSLIYDAVWVTDILSPDTDSEPKDIDIVFTIDSSGSMYSNDRYDIRKSETKKFIDMLTGNDRGAVVDFDSYATLFSSLTSDKTILKAAVNRINSSGGTRIYRGLDLALNQFDVIPTTIRTMKAFYDKNLVIKEGDIFASKESGENGILEKDIQQKMPSTNEEGSLASREANRYIFLLTDGEDNSAYNYNALVNEAISKDVIVYAIGLGSGINDSLLKSISKATGGRYVHANNADDLQGVFEDISTDITDFSKDTDKDGINDYYEKKMDAGLLRLGDGTQFVGMDYDNSDKDNDGLEDGEELIISVIQKPSLDNENQSIAYVKMSSNPLEEDSDGDEINDCEEIAIGTKPLEEDSDGDGLDDGTEVILLYDPLNENADGDSYDDLEEFEKGTNPYEYDKNWLEHTGDFLAGFFAGDFIYNTDSFATVSGQITSSLIPFVDIRDVVANLVHGDVAFAGICALGLIPVAGDLASTVKKVGTFVVKNVDNVPLVMKTIKYAADLSPDLAKALAKNKDVISAISKISKADDLKLTRSGVDDLLKYLDEAGLASKVLKTSSNLNIKSTINIPAGTWSDLSPIKRGNLIDEVANGHSLDKGLGVNFPIADRLEGKFLVSTKSIDPNAKSYVKGNTLKLKLERDANKLIGFENHHKWEKGLFDWGETTLKSSDYNMKAMEIILPDTVITERTLKVLEDFQNDMKTKGMEVWFVIAKD